MSGLRQDPPYSTWLARLDLIRLMRWTCLLNVVLFQGLRRAVYGVLLHVLGHVGILDDRFPFRHVRCAAVNNRSTLPRFLPSRQAEAGTSRTGWLRCVRKLADPTSPSLSFSFSFLPFVRETRDAVATRGVAINLTPRPKADRVSFDHE